MALAWRLALRVGIVVLQQKPRGHVQFVPAGVSNQLRNPGTEPQEVVAIAVKPIQRR